MVRCFICGVPSLVAGSFGNTKKSQVTFVVRILLELGEELEEHLAPGGLLNSWWYTCEQCEKAIDESFNIYKQLVENIDKFRQSQLQLVELYKGVNCSDDVAEHDHSGHVPFAVKCRQTLKNRNWEPIGCKLSNLISVPCSDAESIKIEVKVEEESSPGEDEDQVSFDDDDVEEGQTGGRDEEVSVSLGHAQNDEVETNSDEGSKGPRTRSKLQKSPRVRAPKRKVRVLPNLELNPSTKKFHCPVCTYSSSWKHAVKRHFQIGYHKKPKPVPEMPKVPKKRGRKPTRPKKIPKEKNDPVVLPNLERNPETKKHHCPSCDFANTFRSNVRYHYQRIHLKSLNYPCTWPNCGRAFVNKDNFESHMDRHKGNPRHKCSQCSLAFYSRNPLVRHTQEEHEGGRTEKHIICEHCGMGFSNRDYLYNHRSLQCRTKATALSNEEVICDLCGKTLKRISWRTHMKGCHKGIPQPKYTKWTCSECQNPFVSKEMLAIHLYAKHKIGDPTISKQKRQELKWQCDVTGCRKKFKHEERYKAHMDEAHGPNRDKPGKFLCRFCGQRFFLFGKHKFHETAHENEEIKPFPCDQCGKGFPTMAYLRYHKKHTHKMVLENIQGFRPGSTFLINQQQRQS